MTAIDVPDVRLADVTPEQRACLRGEHEADAGPPLGVPLLDEPPWAVLAVLGRAGEIGRAGEPVAVCRRCRALYVPRPT